MAAEKAKRKKRKLAEAEGKAAHIPPKSNKWK